jgi:MFS family permease
MSEIQTENALQIEDKTLVSSETQVAHGELEKSIEQKPHQAWPIYALFIGNNISYIGDILALLAIPWFVLQTTGSVEQAGITGFCSALPMVLSAFFGSALIDRLGYKRASVIGDILNGLTVMLVPLFYHTVGLAFWQLLVLVFIGGLLRSPADTARAAMLPDLAKLAQMRLERANSWKDGVRRVASFFGAPLAGVLIAMIGTSNLLWLDAISFAISALLIGLLVPAVALHRAQMPRVRGTGGYLAELREGLRFIRLDAVILTIIVVVMITNMLDSAYSAVIAPAYIMQTFHSAVPLGLMIATIGGMAFVGAMIFGTIGHRLPRRLTFGICYTLGGALRLWFLLSANFPLIIGWYALAGLMLGPLNSLIDTVLQERTSPEMRARVFGLLEAGVLAGIPLGTFASGFVVTWIGLNWTLAAMGALYLLTTLSLLVNPALKKMERASAEQV